jgi:hypothetical protein
MLGPDVVVVEALGFLLSETQDFARSLGKLVELIVHASPPSTAEDAKRPSVPGTVLIPFYATAQEAVKKAQPLQSA